MTQQHTKEPWIVVPGGRLDKDVIITTERRISQRYVEICEMDVEFAGRIGEEQKANVRRIVACVNACAGIPTEWLESGTVGCLQNVREERDDLLAENDKLRNANSELLSHGLVSIRQYGELQEAVCSGATACRTRQSAGVTI